MARDYSLNTVVPPPGTPIGYVTAGGKTEPVYVSEEWRRQWFENVGTALFGPTGESDVTLSIPSGSYVAAVAVVANKGISVSGVIGPGYTATLDLSQDIRTTASPQFVGANFTGNVVLAGTIDGRDPSVDGTKLDGIQSGATANSTDAFLLARANHTGSQNLSTIAGVTMTVANLNSLDDGVNSTLHFHSSDRDRANHSGAQAISTVTGLQAALDGKVSKTTSITDASTSHAVTDFATTNAALDALGAKINEIIDALNA